MKCKICEKYFVSETKFKNLFLFEEICKECHNIYDLSPKTEVFPVSYGIVEYMYLYEDIAVNFKQREYLIKNYSVLFQALSNEDKQKLVIIIDDFTYKDLKEEIEYISGFRSVVFMSLFRYNFEDCVKFQ